MKILFASSEMTPLIKTGGLADVSFDLPRTLRNHRQAVRVIVPAYREVLKKLARMKVPSRVRAEFTALDQPVRILEISLNPGRFKVWLVDCPPCFDREGLPYSDDTGADWPDNALRFAVFSKVIAKIAGNQASLNWQPDIVHCNDWQTGLVPVYMHDIPNTGRVPTVFSIHNLNYQGLFPYGDFTALELDQSLWKYQALEYFGQLSFIKGGLVFSDLVVTPSRRYAQEIMTPEFGCGLDGVLRERKDTVIGIPNGINHTDWDPGTDSHLIKNYSSDKLQHKRYNKTALQQDFGLSVSADSMLIGVVSRLCEQKGIDLLLDALDTFDLQHWQIAVLGTGDQDYEQQLLTAAALYPARLGVVIDYHEGLAHQVIAGADVFLMPSRYEPCGLTQLYSMRYGTLPVVRAVGGLADTVVNTDKTSLKDRTATGFVFDRASPEALNRALQTAFLYYRDPPLWQQLQQQAMRTDHSWKSSVKEYLRAYESLTESSSAPGVAAGSSAG